MLKKLITAWICLSIYFASAEMSLFITKEKKEINNLKNFIIVAKDNSKTTLTFSNKFSTNSKNFIFLLPVPESIDKQSIKQVDGNLFFKLISYTSPRIAEYQDYDPCNPNSIRKIIRDPKTTYTTFADNYSYGINNYKEVNFIDYQVTLLDPKESNFIDRFIKKKGYELPSNFLDFKNNAIKNNNIFLVLEATNVSPQSNSFIPIQLEFYSENIKLNNFNPTYSNSFYNVVVFLTKDGETQTDSVISTRLPTDIVINKTALSNINGFLEEVLLTNTKPNELSLLYSWPMFICKPCVNPIPNLNELELLGVDWYKKPTKGRMGLVAPFSAIYITTYFYKSFDSTLQFFMTNEKNNYQALYKVYYPIKPSDSKCGSNYQEILEQNENVFSKNSKTLLNVSSLTTPQSELH